MGRRQVVEPVNSALKGAFVDFGRGSFRVFGQVKVTALLGFTVAGSTSTASAASVPSKASTVRIHRPHPVQSDANVPSAASEFGRSWWTHDHISHLTPALDGRSENLVTVLRSLRALTSNADIEIHAKLPAPRAGSCRFRGGVRVF
jgi:hypothetical protein